MSTIVAFGFPILVVVGTWALLRPGDVLRRLPGGSQTIDRSPLPYRTHLAWTLPSLTLSGGLGWMFAQVQRALLAHAGVSTSWKFSWRATDNLIYAFIPGLFVGMLVSFPIVVRALHWYYGETLVQFLDRPGRDRTRLSLRQEIAIMPRLAAGIAIGAIVLNAAAFDTFLQVGRGVFRFSYFFSPETSEYAVGDIYELAVYSQRVSPIGKITNKSFLEVRLRNGTSIDTYYLIEEQQIPSVIAALQEDAGGRMQVAHYRHPR